MRRKLRWPFWVSTVIAVVLLAGSLCSWLFTLMLVTQEHMIAIVGGGVIFAGNPNFKPGLHVDDADPFLWLPRLYSHAVFIPLYLLAAPFVIASTVMFVRSRRALPGHCANCGYDLAGLDGGTCPECGETPA